MVRGLLLAERYELLEELGVGGMGSVWRARDCKLNAEVAIKLVDPAAATTAEALARFRREAEAAAAIRSTYVVQILDYGVHGNSPFIAMELLRGESLAERLLRKGRLGAAETGRILGHVGRALALAHEHRIVHRDLKPQNVFLAREGDEDIAKVLDFGIARRQDSMSLNGGFKTRAGMLLGTPYYMSPEQTKGQLVDHLSDVWSFGTIAFECLTGCRPFESDTLADLFYHICLAELPVPSQLGPVPAGFDAWFARAAAREPSSRFQSIKEAARELRTLCGQQRDSIDSGETLESAVAATIATPASAVLPAGHPTLAYGGLGLSVAPTSHTNPELKQRTRMVALAVVVLVALAIAIGYSIWHRPEQDDLSRVSASAALQDSAALVSQPPDSIRTQPPRLAPSVMSGTTPDAKAPPSSSPFKSEQDGLRRPRAPKPGQSATPKHPESPPASSAQAAPATNQKSDDNAAGI